MNRLQREAAERAERWASRALAAVDATEERECLTSAFQSLCSAMGFDRMAVEDALVALSTHGQDYNAALLDGRVIQAPSGGLLDHGNDLLAREERT